MGLIAIDLDGTLINNQHEISAENINAIKQAQEHGHTVVIEQEEHILMFKKF